MGEEDGQNSRMRRGTVVNEGKDGRNSGKIRETVSGGEDGQNGGKW